jgi:carbamoyl-phosphate synthase large subunit
VPFVSKAIGVALAKVASLAMAGFKLKDMGFTKEIIPKHFSVKEAVFPFARFPGVDVILTPEMKSTGEVMGIDSTGGMAFLKSQLAAGNPMPAQGNVFLSIRDEDKDALLPLAKRLVALGFTIYATAGTSTLLRKHDIKSLALFRIADGRPNVVDLIEEKQVSWIVNTPTSGPVARIDEVKMRSHAVIRGIPITTTIHGFKAALAGIEAMRDAKRMEVCSIQEFHRHAPRIKYPSLGGIAKAPRRKTA